jgi:hypothetical protein
VEAVEEEVTRERQLVRVLEQERTSMLETIAADLKLRVRASATTFVCMRA